MAEPFSPTASDLEMFLVGAFAGGIFTFDPTRYRLDIAAAAGVQTFNREAHRIMQAGTPATRNYDPPGNRDGYLRTDDFVGTVAITYWPAGDTAGTLLNPQVPNPAPGYTQDYLLDPDPSEAAAKGIPYTGVQFINRQWFTPVPPSLMRSIQINAQWGYGTTIPSDAWEAMLRFGALAVLEQIRLSLLGFLTEWTEAAVTERYDPKFMMQLRGAWESETSRIVGLYFKWTI